MDHYGHLYGHLLAILWARQGARVVPVSERGAGNGLTGSGQPEHVDNRVYL